MLDNSLVMWGNHMESRRQPPARQRFPGCWRVTPAAACLEDRQLQRGGGGKTISNAMADICKAMGVTRPARALDRHVGPRRLTA